MQPDLLIARFGELWLKGDNRHQFTARLQKNLAGALRAAGIRGGQLRIHEARMMWEPGQASDLPAAFEIFRNTPGLANVSACVRAPKHIDALGDAAVELVRQTWTGPPSTFVCRARRVDKHFPENGPLIERTIGDRIGHVVSNWRVDLRTPTHTLLVEILRDFACVSATNADCVGGLPVGTAGRGLLLLSGGLDSPVAGFLAQKRGCELDAVYFHSPPYIPEASREKVEALARNLAARQGGLRLHVAHFTEIQNAIHSACDPKLTVILYRRFMYRIAAAIAERAGIQTLCTGESLGQVASQTLENLRTVDRLTDKLTLRPLIGQDKSEIVAVAHRIGTYETSILPAEDCCTLFVPRHPAVRAPEGVLEANEAKLDVQALIDEALARTVVVEL
jgi:thiamine biosynthesis protein ThiI